MSQSHSPFLIVQDFLSPLLCEKILKDITVKTPDLDINGDPKKSEHYNLFWEQEIIERFREVVPELEAQFKAKYRGLEKPIFQYYPENTKAPAEQPGCENSKYLRKKWVMIKDVDLVGFIWLKDYNENVPLDDSFEVYGGKLEFPVHNFGFQPQRGTLVVFPAGPHFISLISHVLVGDLYQIKLNVGLTEEDGSRWFYQPTNFPGTYQTWLEQHV
jgi:hypothetical protein